ncbi:MAG: hypothetical protein ACOCVG_05215 [Verrucomicrobiota bacterium]
MKTDLLLKLKSASGLLVVAAGADRRQTAEVQAAIDFLRSERDQGRQETPPELYDRTIEDLLRLTRPGSEGWGFRHWNLRGDRYDPLFIRARLLRELRQLAGFPESLLLVTGLREALCPPGRYWTQKVEQRYHEAVDYIERVALKYNTPSTRLSLVFV